MKLFKGLLLLTVILGVNSNSFAGTFKNGQYSGIYGVRNYRIFLPTTTSNKPLPMIIMLHGCDQNADQFAKSSHILERAEVEKFAVLLPEQTIINNPFKCWNWIIPSNNSRQGEPEVIIEMVDQTVKNFNIDTKRVFAAGMSAGASMSGILANCYPDRIKAIASHDGVQFFPTYHGGDFATVVLNGATVPAEQAGALGYSCAYMYNPPKQVPVIIFQGMASPLMNPMHAFQVEDEFKVLNDYLDNGVRDLSAFKDKNIETVPDTKTYGYTKYSFTGINNKVFIERYMINRLNHAWSGGDGKFKYNDPKGPDATSLMIKFFKQFGL
jgi:poly(hydroxyalkanoate) depolymerase family esterase